jgi:hypothetical protein
LVGAFPPSQVVAAFSCEGTEPVPSSAIAELQSRTDVAQVVIDESVVREWVNPTLIPIQDLGSPDLPGERGA